MKEPTMYCPECHKAELAPSTSPGYLYCTRCGRGSIPRPQGYWTDVEIHAAAQRATEKLHPKGEGDWNRVKWIRVMMDELAKGEAGVSTIEEKKDCPKCHGPHVPNHGMAHFDGCDKWDALNRPIRLHELVSNISADCQPTRMIERQATRWERFEEWWHDLWCGGYSWFDPDTKESGCYICGRTFKW